MVYRSREEKILSQLTLARRCLGWKPCSPSCSHLLHEETFGPQSHLAMTLLYTITLR